MADAVLPIVVNGGAGKVGDDAAQALEAAFAKHGVRAQIHAASGPDLCDLARRLADEKPRAIVAARGDGTLNAVASVLAGTGIALGVLPLGTLNHFAKDLGIPLDVDGAAATIAAGH